MNSTIVVNIARFIILLLLQVVVFNRIDLFGVADPYPYILFILLFPVNGNRALLVLSAFFIGLCNDMFLNTGGAHAAACVTLAYLRPYIFKISFGVSYEYQTISIAGKLSTERFSFILTSVVIHHIILYLLEIFRFSLIADVLVRTLLSTVLTLIFCIVIIHLTKPVKR